MITLKYSKNSVLWYNSGMFKEKYLINTFEYKRDRDVSDLQNFLKGFKKMIAIDRYCGYNHGDDVSMLIVEYMS